MGSLPSPSTGGPPQPGLQRGWRYLKAAALGAAVLAILAGTSIASSTGAALRPCSTQGSGASHPANGERP